MKNFLIRNVSSILLFAIALIAPSAFAVQLGGPGDQNGDSVKQTQVTLGSPPGPTTAKLFIQGDKQNRPGTISSSGTTVTGSGTQFMSQVKPGDALTTLNGAVTRKVMTVTNDTSLTVDVDFGQDLSGQVYQTSQTLFAVSQFGQVGIGGDSQQAALTVNGTVVANGGLAVGFSPNAQICQFSPDSTIFYNNTGHFLCFCNAGSAYQVSAPIVACF